jgi:hypothetical protein
MSRCYLYNVATQKKGLLTVRMYDEDLLDFAAACRLRGGTMSSIVHQYAHKVIFEEKQRHNKEDTRFPSSESPSVRRFFAPISPTDGTPKTASSFTTPGIRQQHGS